MQPSLQKKLHQLILRQQEIENALSDENVTRDLNRFKELSKEFSDLQPIVDLYRKQQAAMVLREEAEQLLLENDSELQQLAKQEIKKIEDDMISIEQDLLIALLPQDPNDTRNIFLEIRAGAGGDEAAIFAGDLCRMYVRFAEDQKFQTEIIHESLGDHGGYKEVVFRICGKGVYSLFKFESGVHRVQRVPETEAQGRVHTSTCTVAVLPEMDEIGDIELSAQDIRTDTFRASGAGGQHVQKTDSAVRLTHIPTGIVVECQDERSQHKNRARAMSLLKAKILATERDKQQRERAATRRELVGTGDRSERIRTYNYAQGRLTDHRINLTLYQLTSILEGALSPVVEALAQEYRADLIAALGEQAE